MIDPPEEWSYHSTPVNSLTFGATGGDGIHYSCLTDIAEGPVVLTVPLGNEDNIVGESADDFLRMAYQPRLLLARGTGRRSQTSGISKLRLLRGGCRAAGLLVEADHVSGGVAEPRGYLWCVRTDRRHDIASVGDDGVAGRGDTVDHDVDQQTGVRRGSAAHPRAM